METFQICSETFQIFCVKHFIYYTGTLENFERLRTLHNILNDQKQSRNVRNILECFETFKLVWEHLRVFAWKSTQINSVKRFIMFWMIKKYFRFVWKHFIMFQKISDMSVKYFRYVWKNISELYWNIRTIEKFWNIQDFVLEHFIVFRNIFDLFGNISDCAKNISGLCLGTFSIVPKHFIYVCKTFQNCTGTLEHLKKFWINVVKHFKMFHNSKCC